MDWLGVLYDWLLGDMLGRVKFMIGATSYMLGCHDI